MATPVSNANPSYTCATVTSASTSGAPEKAPLSLAVLKAPDQRRYAALYAPFQDSVAAHWAVLMDNLRESDDARKLEPVFAAANAAKDRGPYQQVRKLLDTASSTIGRLTLLHAFLLKHGVTCDKVTCTANCGEDGLNGAISAGLSWRKE